MQHMKLKYLIIALTVILLAYTSCQKVIDLKLNNAAPQLVIEGNVTDQFQPQSVMLSTSVPFSAQSVYPPVSGATVTITDKALGTFTLVEGPKGTYSTVPFKGNYGDTYTLSVQTGGKTYTATSTMPNLVPLDSLTVRGDVFDNKNSRTITVNYQDPPNIANQYLFVMYINNKQVNTIFTNDDSFTNGRYVQGDLFQNDIDINLHDTVTVNMECIDENIYKYWFSLSQQQGSGPGGGTAPSNPPSNLSNNALGYFSAHTAHTKAVVIEQ